MVVGGLGNAEDVGVSGEMVVGRGACAWARAGVTVTVSLGRGRGLRGTGTALDGPVVLVVVVVLVVTPAYCGWTRRMVPRPRVEPATILGFREEEMVGD